MEFNEHGVKEGSEAPADHSGSDLRPGKGQRENVHLLFRHTEGRNHELHDSQPQNEELQHGGETDSAAPFKELIAAAEKMQQ